MSKVYVVGLGPGNKEYILPKAISTLKKCDLIIGFRRAIESIEFLTKNKKIVNSLKEILNIIKTNNDKNIGIVASGDPCFYGITGYLSKNINIDLEIIPGVSSFQYLMSKISMPWQGAYLGSMHGRKEEFLNSVKENDISIWLTDNKNTPSELCKILIVNSIDAVIYVGENLSYDDEKIIVGKTSDIVNMTFSDLCVVVIKR
ncbi:putative cobalt-precorrin-6Y C(5)-methyltransferase [Clostridium tepidiprofundi DSM 19306]|uniref:Putative cobalt-precorrin-6Y C(5)-methyltransferase n=2 Tax=Clostridium TaxID=1485 RepID=A0A151B6F8_9CLOT|nr:putative cobalt-precorrin-6Y C(5)-methyltransferase [Clostridium tepidiprofundi DSM 19306]